MSLTLNPFRWRAPKTEKATTTAEPVTRATLGLSSRTLWMPANHRSPHARELVQRYGHWVYKCANTNADFAASIPLRLFSVGSSSLVSKSTRFKAKPVDKKTKHFLMGNQPVKPCAAVMKKLAGNQGDLTEIMDHPILDLFNDVNEYHEGFAFRQQTFVDLDIFGQWFWNVVAERGGMPYQFWRMLPQLMDVVPDPVKFVSHYLYGKEMPRRRFEVEDVVWCNIPDPDNPWGAFGPLAAWLKSVDATFAMQAFQEDMFNRGGAPDWLIIAKGGMDDDAKRTFRQNWRNLFGRMFTRREHVAIINGDVEATQISDSPKELDYTNSELSKRDELLAAFGVPRAFVDTEGVVANSREARNQYFQLTIWPRTKRVEEVWNQRLIPRWSDRLILVHDNPLEEDPAIRVQERASKLASGWTVNEVRLEEGDEQSTEPQADVAMISNAVVPLSMAGMSGLAGLGGMFGEQDAMDVEAGVKPPDVESGQIETTEEMVLNGAQITAATAVVVAVAAGDIPRDSGIGQLEVLFNLTSEQAERIMGTAGTNTPTTPNPNPKEEAEREAELEAARASGSMGGNGGSNGNTGGRDTDKSRRQVDHRGHTGQDGTQAAAAHGAKRADGEDAHTACGPGCVHSLHRRGAAGVDGQSHRTDGSDCVSQKSLLYSAWNSIGKAGGDTPQDDAGSIKGFRERMQKTLRAKAIEVVRGMEPALTAVEAAAIADRIIANPAWLDDIAAAARPFIQRAVEVGGTHGLELVRDKLPKPTPPLPSHIDLPGLPTDEPDIELPEIPEVMSFDVTNPEVQKFVDQHVVRLASSVQDFTRVAAKDLLGDGLEKGETVQELVGRIKPWTETDPETPRIGDPGARAEMIARTESSRAYVRGERAAWEQAGSDVVQGVKFVLAADACEICEAFAAQVNNQVFPVNAPIMGKGASIPLKGGGTYQFDYDNVWGGDIHPQCRCDVEPVLQPEFEV